MAFPEWMGPNIEPRHVEMMGWGWGPVPELGPGAARVEPPPGEENRYSPSMRYVALLKSGRQLVVYDADTLRARERLSRAAGPEVIMRVTSPIGGLWVGGAHLEPRVLVDGRKAVG